MNIKLSQWEPNTDPQKESLLGTARVELNEKMYIWMSVRKNSKGGMYVKFPAVRLNGEFQSAIGWHGQNIESKIREAIMPELLKRLNVDPDF